MTEILNQVDVALPFGFSRDRGSGGKKIFGLKMKGHGVPSGRGLAGGLFVIAALLAGGCSGKKTAPIPPVPVTIAQALLQSEPLSVNAIGFVEPIETVSVKAQVGGVINQVPFSEGQDVRAGQILFQIDPRPFQVALDAALAQMARDKSQAANAQIQAKRYADLVKKDYVTQEQYDSVRTQAEMLRSTVQVDEAAVAQARLNLDYATIKAPISGRTGSLLVKRGNVVRANDAPLVIINQINPIRVSFSIPGDQLPQVQKYAARGKLEVHVQPSRNGGGSEVKGYLTFLDNTVDPQTGTVTLKAECPNKTNSLWPGQFVDTELVLSIETAVLTVPVGAVVTGQDGTFVFIVGPDRTVRKQAVKINRTLDSIVVVDKGLMAGDTVVTDGQMRLLPGAAVQIKSSLADKGRAQ
jgi:membrane fusion protein, multidrug efflux system